MGSRPRLRDLGISIGRLPPGPYNAITDVPGVRVGHVSVVFDREMVARTGVTLIAPRENTVDEDRVFAGFHSFNGCGAMTGLLWLEESGMLSSEIALTGTYTVGTVYDALVRASREGYGGSQLPVVAETYDGYLNEGPAFHVTQEHVLQALHSASGGPVAEGNVGGGTGMKCHEFKGGIGTSSRVARINCCEYTVGVLVQANQGHRIDLTIDGVPVGRDLGVDVVPGQQPGPGEEGSSIIVIVATDAPLLPFQCRRLAQRAVIGLARTGSYGHNWSGDIFLAFATGNHLTSRTADPDTVQMIPNPEIDPLFLGAAEATEEAILNAMCAAETMVGWKGRTIHAMPLDRVVEVMRKYNRL
ncbi:MAG: P1 family peptidase [Anaerolineae bacterium]|nr:P1 family peptidase [Anaerolineae bacterium]